MEYKTRQKGREKGKVYMAIEILETANNSYSDDQPTMNCICGK